MSMNMAKKVSLYGMLIALAFILNYVESLFPLNFGIPGAKLGLANIVVLVALYMLGGRPAFLLSVVRIVLTGITFSGMFHMVYGMAGALASFAVMSALYKTRKFGVAGVSMAGGVSHNMAQIAIACLILSKGIIYYLPFLLIAGLISGALVGATGVVVMAACNKLSRTR